MISTYACPISEDTIPQIVADAAKWNLNVDYLDGDMQEAAECDTTAVAILSVNYKFRHATFTTMWTEDFENTWAADGATHNVIWNRVQLTAAR